ncbi:hypothetical protein M378DRAFT_808275 [Amanita muscaria Koide BX008]|uniref:Uncharacterized protein n=1 Tax=Amanita muscaria (strain Koide BX008) TaxID=946122 RepID=A0A0C2T685_AMAMK|nr:hypothetical protein M378DRAFT_808275 [Amanita muscaria Koide BX008]
MGRSAKVHKRIPKKLKSAVSSAAGSSANPQKSASAPPQSKAQDAKKRAGLKAKASKNKKSSGPTGSGVLGDADYVSLMMGGRRKAREEAEKLPQDDDEE